MGGRSRVRDESGLGSLVRWLCWVVVLGCSPAWCDIAYSSGCAVDLVGQAQAYAVGSPARSQCLRAAAQWALAAVIEFHSDPQRSEDEWLPVRQALSTVSATSGPACTVGGVPYVRQSHPSLCATACALMALRYLGVQATEEQLLKLIPPNAPLTGVHVDQLEGFILHCKARALIGEGSVDLLRCALAAGYPVLVYQRAWTDNDTEHMRVVTGFDDTARKYATWDPSPDMGPTREIAYDAFERLWALPWREDGLSYWLCVIYAGPQR